MGIPRSTGLIPNGIAMGEISQHQPNPQPPMIKTKRYESSFSIRSISLALVVLMLPLSARGYGQTTVTQSIPTGVTLTNSNSGITEVKPSEPIKPVISQTTLSSDDKVDKVLADIGSFQAQASKAHIAYADPENPTKAELVDLYSYLRSITPKEQEFISRIEALLTADSQNGSTMPSDRKEALQVYLKSLKDDKAASEKAISDINSFLNRGAETSSSVVSVAASTPPPQPAPTHYSTPWYKTPEAQKTWWTLGTAAALTIMKGISDKLTEQVQNH